MYLLGSTTLTSLCYIWTEGFYDFNAVNAYDRNNPKQAFDVYISLKFEGPSFGSAGVEDRVLCDKFVVVKK